MIFQANKKHHQMVCFVEVTKRKYYLATKNKLLYKF